jgi:hypothetical protein
MRKADRFLGAFSLCVLSLLIFSAPLYALDLTLHVPVELPYMPASIVQGKVVCEAYGANRVSGVMDPRQFLGKNEMIFSIRGGFISFVDVVIRAAGNNPPTGIGWICTLLLLDTKYKNPAPNTATNTPIFVPADLVMKNYYVDPSKPVKYRIEGIR